MQIYNCHEQSTGKIALSKGNQIKLKVDNIWYKADFLGYEGAAEYVSSELLKQSNIKDYVSYSLERITLNDKEYCGCSSKNFLKEDEELITAHKLFLNYKGVILDSYLNTMSLKDRIKYFVDTVEEITGIQHFGQYLTLLLEWDSFILNEDRHFNNIAFIHSDNGFKIAPLFDNGAAFLSDVREDYPLHKNIYGLLPTVESKPFSSNFDKQVDVCIELYGSRLQFHKNLELSEEIKENITKMYGESIWKRIDTIFHSQKWNYMEYLNLFNEEKTIDIDR